MNNLELLLVDKLPLEEYIDFFDSRKIKNLSKSLKKLDKKTISELVQEINENNNKLSKKESLSMIGNTFSIETLGFDILSFFTEAPLSSITMFSKILLKLILFITPDSKMKDEIEERLIDLSLYKRAITTGVSVDYLKVHKISEEYATMLGKKVIKNNT